MNMISNKSALVLLSAFFLFCSGSLIAKHYSFDTHAFDTGVQAEVARNAAFHFTYDSAIMNMNYLADHFSPALAIPGLLFYLWDNPAAALIFQNVCVFISILLAFQLATLILKDNKSAMVLSIVFAANYYLHNVNNGEYHIETLALPLFMALFILLERKKTIARYFLIILVSLSLLLIKEDLPLVLGSFGIWVAIFKKGNRPEGIFMALIGFVGFYWVTAIMMPDYANGILRHTERYASLGNTSIEILKTAITRPDKIIAILAAPPIKLLHILYLFLSFLILPLASPLTALTCAVPILIHSFSNYRPQYIFSSQYSLPAIPFLFYSALYGWKRIESRFAKTRVFLGKITLTGITKAIVIFMALTALFPLIRYANNYYKLDFDYYRTFDNNIRPLIPLDCRVISPNHIQPQLIKVKYSGILMGRHSLEFKPDYIILANDRIPTFWQKTDYLDFSADQKRLCQVVYEDSRLTVLKTRTESK